MALCPPLVFASKNAASRNPHQKVSSESCAHFWTWKKSIIVRKPISTVEKCPQIHIFSNHIKVSKMHRIFFDKKGIILESSADLLALMGKYSKKNCCFSKNVQNFLKIVWKHCLHVCYFSTSEQGGTHIFIFLVVFICGVLSCKKIISVWNRFFNWKMSESHIW